jgi:hypothetical protein
MATRYDNASPVTSCDETRIRAVLLTHLELGLIKDTRHKMVALLPRIANPKRSNDHHQELEHLETCHIEAESNHVLVSSDRMGLGKPSNILGVIEKSLTLRRHEAGIVLTETLQTSSIRHSHMGFPVGVAQRLSRSYFNLDAAVDYRDEVSVRDEV